MAKKTAHQIDGEAAGWAARIDRGPVEPAEEQAFQAWMRENVVGKDAGHLLQYAEKAA